MATRMRTITKTKVSNKMALLVVGGVVIYNNIKLF